MATTKNKYRRSPGRGRKNWGLFDSTRHQLWFGSDHMLHLQAKAYSETCKRFYFKDIQALVISRTTAGRTAGMVMSIAAGVFLIIGLLAASSWENNLAPAIIFWVIGGMFIVFALVNFLLGPTCMCRLYTAVQAEDLYSLSRLRTAEKVVGMLKPMIEAAQGSLTREDLEADSEGEVRLQASAHAVFPAPAPAQEDVQIKHEHGKYHAALFYLLLVLAVSACIDIFFQHPIKNLADGIMLAPLAILLVLALRKQANSDLPPVIKNITWTVFGFSIASFIIILVYSSFYTMFKVIEDPQMVSGGSLVNMKFESPVFVVSFAITAFVYSALAIIGLLRLDEFRNAYKSFLASHSTSPTSEPE